MPMEGRIQVIRVEFQGQYDVGELKKGRDAWERGVILRRLLCKENKLELNEF